MNELNKKTEGIADLGLLIMAFIWGSGFVVTKTTLDVLSSNQVMFLRFTIATITLFIFCIKKLNLITFDTIKKSIIIGIALFFGFEFQTIGLVQCSAGKSGFLTSTYVAFVPIITILVAKKTPCKYNLIAAAMMITGIFFLTGNFQNGFYINKFDIITLIGSVCWGFHVFFVGHFSKGEDPVILCMLQTAVAGILAFFMLLLTKDFAFNINVSTAKSVMYLGVVSSAIAFLIQNVAQKYTTSTHAGILMSMESVFATILGIIFLNEHFSLQMLFGAGIIFLALIIAETKLSFLKLSKKETSKESV